MEGFQQLHTYLETSFTILFLLSVIISTIIGISIGRILEKGRISNHIVAINQKMINTSKGNENSESIKELTQLLFDIDKNNYLMATHTLKERTPRKN